MMHNKITLLPIILIVSACSNSPTTDHPNNNHHYSDAKIIIIPMEDTADDFINDISKYINEKHGLKTNIYPKLKYSDSMLAANDKQYYAVEIASKGVEKFSRTYTTISDKAILIITNKDINLKKSKNPYVFSSTYRKFNLTVISTYRIKPKYYELDTYDHLFVSRLHKLINKSLGENYYKYKLTSNKKSVMYNGTSSMKDLDAMSEWY